MKKSLLAIPLTVAVLTTGLSVSFADKDPLEKAIWGPPQRHTHYLSIALEGEYVWWPAICGPRQGTN